MFRVIGFRVEGILKLLWVYSFGFRVKGLVFRPIGFRVEGVGSAVSEFAFCCFRGFTINSIYLYIYMWR